MAINASVEIFVIKTLSALNLVVISVVQPGQGAIVFVLMPKDPAFLLQELAQSPIVS
jgi:hypothetical protein